MRNSSQLPAPEYLRQRLRYEPVTGKLFWRNYDHPKFTAWNTKYAGTEAFTCINPTNGYRHGRIDYVAYQAHRVAWAVYFGEWPTKQLDHIDHDRTNNRIENLREVSHQENHRNATLKANNTSGHAGVSWFKGSSRWSAYIMVDRRKIHLGYYPVLDDAVAARKAAERQHGFHPNHGRVVA